MRGGGLLRYSVSGEGELSLPDGEGGSGMTLALSTVTGTGTCRRYDIIACGVMTVRIIIAKVDLR